MLFYVLDIFLKLFKSIGLLSISLWFILFPCIYYC